MMSLFASVSDFSFSLQYAISQSQTEIRGTLLDLLRSINSLCLSPFSCLGGL